MTYPPKCTEKTESSKQPNVNHLNTLCISFEDAVNSMKVSKEIKEATYRNYIESTGAKPDSYDILWKDDKILGIRPHQSIKVANVVIMINPDGIVSIS